MERLTQQEVLLAKLKGGEIIGRDRNGVIFFKWNDKRDVSLLTIKHNDNG